MGHKSFEQMRGELNQADSAERGEIGRGVAVGGCRNMALVGAALAATLACGAFGVTVAVGRLPSGTEAVVKDFEEAGEEIKETGEVWSKGVASLPEEVEKWRQEQVVEFYQKSFAANDRGDDAAEESWRELAEIFDDSTRANRARSSWEEYKSEYDGNMEDFLRTFTVLDYLSQNPDDAGTVLEFVEPMVGEAGGKGNPIRKIFPGLFDEGGNLNVFQPPGQDDQGSRIEKGRPDLAKTRLQQLERKFDRDPQVTKRSPHLRVPQGKGVA